MHREMRAKEERGGQESQHVSFDTIYLCYQIHFENTNTKGKRLRVNMYLLILKKLPTLVNYN